MITETTRIFQKQTKIQRRKNMKKFVSLLLACMMTLSLAACGTNASDSTTAKPAADGAGTTAAAAAATTAGKQLSVVYLGGKLGDNSVSDAIYAGFKKAETDFGVKTTMVELPTDTSKYTNAVAEAVDQQPDLIFGSAGSGLIDCIIAAAEENPDILFMCLDAPTDQAGIDGLDNFVGNMAKQSECSFLVGYLAAKMSETGKISGIVGVEYPVLRDFIVGYIDGAQTANPDIKVGVGVIGNFTDQAMGKEVALAQYRNGADVVYAIAGTASYGILAAAKEVNKYCIGVDVDMAAPFVGVDDAQANLILTSAIKDWGYLSYHWIERVVNGGEIAWGDVEIYGIANGGATFTKNDIYMKLVPADIQAEMDELVKKFQSGEMKCASYFNDDGSSMTDDDYMALKDKYSIT